MSQPTRINLIKGAFQDGPDFYLELGDAADSCEKIASYPHLVKNDYDMAGSTAARQQFATEHPQYVEIDRG